MKQTVQPRLFAAVASVVITLVLFDQVATMGQSDQPPGAASAAAQPAAYHVAAAGR